MQGRTEMEAGMQRRLMVASCSLTVLLRKQQTSFQAGREFVSEKLGR